MTTLSPDLVILACSDSKQPTPAPALDLYTGVLYSTFRAQVDPAARPHVAILSARHGLVSSNALLEPYNQKLTPERAQEIVTKLPSYARFLKPVHAHNVLLAGGQAYREVMRAAMPALMAAGVISDSARVIETQGGIGYQRQQLGQFLRECSARVVIGHHPNGTPIFQALDGFTVGQPVVINYRGLPGLPAKLARINQLFYGPGGPTADVSLEDSLPNKPKQRWVALKHLQPHETAQVEITK